MFLILRVPDSFRGTNRNESGDIVFIEPNREKYPLPVKPSGALRSIPFSFCGRSEVVQPRQKKAGHPHPALLPHNKGGMLRDPQRGRIEEGAIISPGVEWERVKNMV